MMKFRLSPWVPAALSIAYHFFPPSAFFPFLISACVHELGHIAAIALMGGSIRSMQISLRGAVLETAFLSGPQEAFCAAAGPLAGLLLVFFYRLSPWLAFWSLSQSLFNLFPMYPLDGGRALACILPYVPDRYAVWGKPLAFLVWILAALAVILW